MKALIVTILVLALAGGAWWLTSSRTASPPATGHPPAVDGHRAEPSAPRAAAPAAGPAAAEPSFRERLRAFTAGASGLSEADRQAQADALRRDTLAREADGSLLPAESAYIQLALLRATITDEDLLRRRSQALLDRYRTASEQGWEDYRRRAEPRHQAYREAEAELIRRARQDDVAEEELRERLQALRAQYYD